MDDASSIDAFEGYLDMDEDGFSMGSTTSVSCDNIYEEVSEDCNDQDDDNAVGTISFFVDADGDGQMQLEGL